MCLLHLTWSFNLEMIQIVNVGTKTQKRPGKLLVRSPETSSRVSKDYSTTCTRGKMTTVQSRIHFQSKKLYLVYENYTWTTSVKPEPEYTDTLFRRCGGNPLSLLIVFY